jgi:hypothetical protein
MAMAVELRSNTFGRSDYDRLNAKEDRPAVFRHTRQRFQSLFAHANDSVKNDGATPLALRDEGSVACQGCADVGAEEPKTPG